MKAASFIFRVPTKNKAEAFWGQMRRNASTHRASMRLQEDDILLAKQAGFPPELNSSVST
jgi:hypothetical protein